MHKLLNVIVKKIEKIHKLIIVTLVIAISATYFYKVGYKNYYLTVTAPIQQKDGIGRQAIDFINLVKDKVELNVVAREKKNLPEYLKENLPFYNDRVGYVVLSEHALLDLMEGNPYDIFLNPKKNKVRNLLNKIPRKEQIYITYSMFETDAIPEAAVYTLNTYWDMVVVPDEIIKEIYLKSGVTTPIFVLPLGIDLKTHLNYPLKQHKNEIFKFANFSTMEDRKNILLLIKAFHAAFKNNNDVKLLISSRGYRGNEYKNILDYIINNNVTNVEIDKVGAKEEDYFNFLFSQIDCYVSPSKGEGFSIIPREAMARGIPVILSDAIAQKTIADTGLVKVVHASKLVPGNYTVFGRIAGNFIDIDASDLEEAMKDVYDNYKKYLDKSTEARKWAANWQYKNFEEEYINLVQPKKIILGNDNKITKDYLMTNSQKLYNKWMHLKEIGVLK